MKLSIKDTILLAMIFFASCSESTTNTQEKAELNTMDSISNEARLQKDKLEEQTKKVEESLEKLDNEFDSTKK